MSRDLRYIYDFKNTQEAFFYDVWRYGDTTLLEDLTWLNETSATYLDYLLMAQYGKREIDDLAKIILGDNNQLSDVNRSMLVNIILMKLVNIWKRMYETLNVEYDPLTNYKKVEKYVPNTTIQTDTEINVKVENKTYGFNDDESVPSSDVIQDKASNTQGETKAHTGLDTTTTIATQDMGANPSAYQDLIKQEIDTRIMYNFYGMVVKSVADELTILVM